MTTHTPYSKGRIFSMQLPNEEAMQQARLLKAVADPTRLQIVRLLSQHGGDICVEELVDCLACLAQPTVSHHLRILRDAGVIDGRKHGLYMYYYVKTDVLRRIQHIVAGLHSVDIEAIANS